MDLSKVVASLAILLAVMLAGGYARGDGPSGPAVKETVQDRLVAREAMQRAAPSVGRVWLVPITLSP